MYKIKKYANGRFYDTEAKTYVTQPQILDLQKSGKKITIVEAKSGKDITHNTLSHLKAKMEKTTSKPAAKKTKSKAAKPSPGTLAQLIKKGGDSLSGYGKKYTDMWHNMVTMSKDEVDKLMNKLVKDNKISKFEADKFKKEVQRYRENIEDWFSKTVDNRVNELLGRMNLANREQIVKLTDEIEALNKKIKALEKSKADAAHEASKTKPKTPKT